MSLSYGVSCGYDVIEVPSYPSVTESLSIGGTNIMFIIEQEPDVCFIGKNSFISLHNLYHF